MLVTTASLKSGSRSGSLLWRSVGRNDVRFVFSCERKGVSKSLGYVNPLVMKDLGLSLSSRLSLLGR